MSLSTIINERLPAIDGQERQIGEWYVLLWSQSQNAFHIERVRHMLASNRRAYADDRRMDYVPVFFGSQDDTCKLADALRGTIRTREQLRNSGGEGERDAR